MIFHPKKKIFLTVILNITVTILLSSCSTMTPVNSIWQNGTATFDKDNTMWKGNMLYFPDEKVSIGIKNDNDNLYLCFKTADPSTLRKAMSSGLTVWLNNSDDKAKAVGIRYPDAFKGRNAIKMNTPEGSDRQEFENKNPEKNMDIQDFKMPSEMTLMIGEDQEKKKMSIAEAKSKYKIILSLRNEDDVLYYQVTIPLSIPELNFSLIPKPGRNFGIGIETGEFKRPDRDRTSQNSDGMGMPGSTGYPGGGGNSGFPGGIGSNGMGGMGGSRRGGNGGRSGYNQNGMNKESFEPLNLWLSVELAKKK